MAAPARHGTRFSCERCFERKVKCDKEYPCGKCSKSGLQCIQRLPSAPRRRRREEQLLERLQRADQLLRQHERSQAEASPVSLAATTPGSSAQGRLFKTEGSVRFVNNDIWNAVESELPEIVDERSSEAEDDAMSVDGSCDLIMGISSSPEASLSSFHPSPLHIRHLWQVFLENVNPLSKMVHRPTTAKVIDRACDQVQSLDRTDEVLLFAIYLSAVISMTPEDCQRSFREPRTTLSHHYQKACREALVRAKFLRTSSLEVLKSFVMYLQALRKDLDSFTFWALTGVASRIAQGLGLHQNGSTLGLSVFDTEMRSRTWWQVLWLEIKSTERTGAGSIGQEFLHGLTAPRNIDDDDFWPGQTEQELEAIIRKRGTNRATEMINSLIMCENATFWREQMIKTGDSYPSAGSKQIFGAPRRDSRPWEEELKHRVQLINELENRVEEKYLRYCDPSVASQLLATIYIRGSMAYLRFMTHHPRCWPSEAETPPEQPELLWRLSLRILDINALQYTTPSLQKFSWKFTEYFHWQALVYVLQELRKEPTSDRAVQGFARIHQSFLLHRSFIEDKIALHVALCSLALKVWDARVEALQKLGAHEEAPAYIETLLKRREAAAVAAASKKQAVVKEQSTGAESAAQKRATSREAEAITKTARDQPLPAETAQSAYMDYVSVEPQLEQLYYPFMGGGEVQDASFMDWNMWDNLIQDFEQGSAALIS